MLVHELTCKRSWCCLSCAIGGWRSKFCCADRHDWPWLL